MKTLVSVEEYLRTPYDPDCDYEKSRDGGGNSYRNWAGCSVNSHHRPSISRIEKDRMWIVQT
jgi:hypothetical protein